jgi:hypothetical protein
MCINAHKIETLLGVGTISKVLVIYFVQMDGRRPDS